jgi:hypothetical protein
MKCEMGLKILVTNTNIFVLYRNNQIMSNYIYIVIIFCVSHNVMFKYTFREQLPNARSVNKNLVNNLLELLITLAH